MVFLFLVLILHSIGTVKVHARKDSDLATANKLLEAANFSDCLTLCAKHLKEEGNTIEWLEMRSRAKIFHAGGHQTVLPTVKEAYDLAPKDPKLMLNYAWALACTSKRREARSMAEELGRIYPNRVLPKAILELSTLGPTTLNKAKEAQLLKLAEQAGKEGEVYVALSTFFDDIQQREGEFYVCDLWTKAAPKSPLAWLHRAYANAHRKDFNGAVADCNRVLSLNPNCTAAMEQVTFDLRAAKRYKEGVKAAERQIAHNLGYPTVLQTKGDCHMELKEYSVAILCYTKALKGLLGKDAPVAQLTAAKQQSRTLKKIVLECWRDRAKCYVSLGQPEKALSDLRLMLILHPGDGGALEIRRHIYEDQKKYDLAIKDLSTLIEVRPTVAPWYKERARLYAKVGREQDAKNDLNLAERLETTGSIK